jgi:hypothetical protein
MIVSSPVSEVRSYNKNECMDPIIHHGPPWTWEEILRGQKSIFGRILAKCIFGRIFQFNLDKNRGVTFSSLLGEKQK